MTPIDEAAAILVRVLEALARRSGATLKPSTRSDIARACELLTSAGVEIAKADPQFQEWKARRNKNYLINVI